MKKILFVFLFTLLLAFSGPALAAAPNAANADAGVTGLWLTCPGFPADAEVLEFTDDTDMDMVTYIRGLDDGLLTFEIRRQPIAESELQSPEDVTGLIEMRVNNDDIDEEALQENLDDINVTEDAEDFAEFFSYPCAAAEYNTGAGENARKNAALFIFTDVYCFEVNMSMALDSADEYNERLQEWVTGMEFVENESGDGANAADADVTGLWLEVPGFPKDAEAEINIDDDGQVVYMRTLEDGAFTMVISRIPNSDNAITMGTVGKFISGFSGVSEDDLRINVRGPDDDFFPFGEYPVATVEEYESKGDGVTKENTDFCFFPEGYFFWVHMEFTDAEVMLEKYGDAVEKWFSGIRLVER